MGKKSLIAASIVSTIMTVIVTLVSVAISPALGQQRAPWSADEKPIVDQIRSLRSLPDDVRAATTKSLALQIRKLPASGNKLRLALGLANLSTEGDFGHDTLQEVATTLAVALRENPVPWDEPKKSKHGEAPAIMVPLAPPREPASPYKELALLARYEHVEVSSDFIKETEQYRVAVAELEADDSRREHAEFVLKDLSGKTWTFSELRGKVVLVNFWATWCPPCRKEMPDLESLYEKFGPQGLVVLGISDEDAGKVEPFIHERKFTFPVLLDPERKVNKMFAVEGIPKSFVFDRNGKLVAQSIDMRTQKQFLEMLAKAGLGESQK
jgi:peroxiredoxin